MFAAAPQYLVGLPAVGRSCCLSSEYKGVMAGVPHPQYEHSFTGRNGGVLQAKRCRVEHFGLCCERMVKVPGN